MNSFEALSLMDSENVNTLTFDHSSLQIDAPDTNPALFYATFDGKLKFKSLILPFFSLGYLTQATEQKNFRISFMIVGSLREEDNPF